MKIERRCSRRAFLRTAAKTALAVPMLLQEVRLRAAESHVARASEAMFYEKLPAKKVRCLLCPNECRVADGQRGDCGVRENRGGVLQTLVYGQPCAVHVDPIEKKPLFHYLPGSQAFSLATAGCNFNCRFCQNWEISQRRPEQVRAITLPPEAVIRQAREHGCPIIAHTYSEPVVFYEYVRDCAALGREKGDPQRHDLQRLHPEKAAAGTLPPAGRGQDRPQGVHAMIFTANNAAASCSRYWTPCSPCAPRRSGSRSWCC